MLALFVAVLSPFGLPASSTGLTEPDPGALSPSARQIRFGRNLAVSQSSTERLVVRGKCESGGIRDIRMLMMHSRFEELWAFVPASDPASCMWVEIGIEAHAEAESATITVDWDYLELLMARHESLYLYHFHPLAYFARCKLGPGCNRFFVPTRSGVVAQSALVTNLQFAMPSAEDIYFMSESAWRMDRNQPGGDVRHRVITPYGVVEYGLSDAGKKKYAENRGSRMEGLYIKLVAANSLADEHILGVIEQSPMNMTVALEALVASMNSRNLQVTLVAFD